MSGIYVVGDTHADFGWLNEFIGKNTPEIVMVCGDFGIWQYGHDVWYHDSIVNPETKIYFCDGNHEKHSYLCDLVRKYGWENPIEIKDNIFYCPRGSSITLPDNRRVLFFGGALSVDKHLRKAYFDWFPEEEITQQECNRVSENDKYDIVISHTCPREFHDRMFSKCTNAWKNKPDVSEIYLSDIYHRVNPSLWYFGHWHLWDDFIDGNCHFYAMNMTPFNYYSDGYMCFRELEKGE